MLNVPRNGRLSQFEFQARFQGSLSDVIHWSMKASEQRGHVFNVISTKGQEVIPYSLDTKKEVTKKEATMSI